jgi:acetyl-CoA carboxylase carboxyltransferase component
MTVREKTEELKQKRARYELGGGQKTIDRLHQQGKLTARERIAKLIDPGTTFRELNLWAKPTRTGYDIDQREAPGDAAVIGIGKVNGRPVFIYAHDFTTLGGTQSSVQNWKVTKTIEGATRLGIPYVGIVDSGGVRIYDSFGEPDGRGVSTDCDTMYSPSRASGVVPSITLTLGASYAGTAYSPMLSDVFFMVKRPYCYMSLSSPELLKTVTFVDVTREEIGGPALHSEVTGSCDFLGETEEESIEATRKLLSFLPSNCRENPPIVDTGDDPARQDEAMLDIIPSDTEETFDTHQVIWHLVDNGDFFELKRDYAKSIITGFARLDGKSVGIIGNNSMFLNGALDRKAAEKEARFIRYCDAYNVPLLFLVDTPGFIISAEEEKDGVIRHGAMVMHAICEATVPKITLYLRRCYKEGYLAMGTRLMGNDFAFAWPNAQIQPVKFEEAVEAIYHQKTTEVAPEELEQFSQKYFDSPYQAGALLIVDDIINPQETRPILIEAFESASKKTEVRPTKKHDIIPL